jgi:hypothetical protein
MIYCQKAKYSGAKTEDEMSNYPFRTSDWVGRIDHRASCTSPANRYDLHLSQLTSAMKAASAQFTENQRTSVCLRIFFVTAAATATFLSTGCSGPVQGPTNPKGFISQGRQWTNSSQDSTAPAASAPATPVSNDPANPPPPNG